WARTRAWRRNRLARLVNFEPEGGPSKGHRVCLVGPFSARCARSIERVEASGDAGLGRQGTRFGGRSVGAGFTLVREGRGALLAGADTGVAAGVAVEVAVGPGRVVRRPVGDDLVGERRRIAIGVGGEFDHQVLARVARWLADPRRR